ncbi:putative receptor like protein 25 [Papaver somniferum]|uniref:putative receptor like protein 25 n=1 Tax=Papaver somniferum TaxID=3469 RepID=UPI000E6F7C30|nr:putative receptor like protein 25 [Papaver somniferum]
MIINKEEREWNHQDQILQNDDVRIGLYYQPKVTVTSKGIDIELVKILTIFTSIDLSNNRFEGRIPEIIGSLTALCILNFSDDAFTGKIPSTFGNLTYLESLDLSRNNLTGKIPFQLAGLSSLSVLNVSFNKLVGEIPSGGQFQTFDSSYFQGNVGLCGFPLSKGCNTTVESPPNGSKSKDGNASEDEFDWIPKMLCISRKLKFSLMARKYLHPIAPLYHSTMK